MKPKIAIILPSYGLVHRGTENFTSCFVEYLENDFNITVFVKEKTKPFTKRFYCISETNKILQLAYRLYPWKNQLDKYCLSPDHIEALIFSLSIFPHLLLHHYDIVFPQTGFWGALLARIIRRLKGTPFIYRSAGGIEPLVAKQNPDAYFCINPGIQKWFKKYFPQMCSIFICNGVDIDHFKPLGKKAKISLQKPIIMTTAALIPSKRVDLTIKAVAKIKSASLLIVGTGPLLEELKELAKKEIGMGKFLFVNNDYVSMPQLYRSAEVFAFAAPDELGWGMVHLEAAASGLPIVSNSEANLEFLFGKRAYLCDVNDVVTYSKYIQKAIAHPSSLRNRVMKYAWEKTAIRYKKYIYEIINNRV